MRFSERHGIVQARSVVQSDGIDDALANSLWNIFDAFVLRPLEASSHYPSLQEYHLIERLWLQFFKQPLDEIRSASLPDVSRRIRRWYFGASWFTKYDFIEFVAGAL